MNFKPTLLKIIIALVIGILSGYFILYRIETGTVFNSFGRFILFFLIAFVLVYVIWSLIQKKKS